MLKFTCPECCLSVGHAPDCQASKKPDLVLPTPDALAAAHYRQANGADAPAVDAHADLRKLAEAATPGERTWGSEFVAIPRHGSYHQIARAPKGVADSLEWESNAAFMAECDPARIIALLGTLEAQRATIAGLELKLENFEAKYTMGVGRGDGSLFVHGSYEAIKACQALISAAALAQAAPASPNPARTEITEDMLDDEIMSLPCNWNGAPEHFMAVSLGHTMACEQAAIVIAKRNLLAPASRPATEEAVGPLPERDQSKPSEQQGMFRKFIIVRTDGSSQPGGKHHRCRYFALDLTHDQYAPPAMRAYAAACRATHPHLADDIERDFPAPASPASAPVASERISLNVYEAQRNAAESLIGDEMERLGLVPKAGPDEVSQSQAILLAGIQGMCISANQELARCDGALSEWDKGWFMGQLHVFDQYTPVEKIAIEQARGYLSKIATAPLPPVVARKDGSHD